MMVQKAYWSLEKKHLNSFIKLSTKPIDNFRDFGRKN